MNRNQQDDIIVRQRTAEDDAGVIQMCRAVYPFAMPYDVRQLTAQREAFPEGQLVAIETAGGRVVGMAASLIVLWEDYEVEMSWHDFTEGGSFANHDPSGRTLYGAEVMVHPGMQRRGVGKRLYKARRELVNRFGLLRIRAGARMRGYHEFSDKLTPREYARKVAQGELHDPTLSFQMKHGFKILRVVPEYLPNDVESEGHAALIEWLNPDKATDKEYREQEQAMEKL